MAIIINLVSKSKEDLYDGTKIYFRDFLSRFKVATTFVNMTHLKEQTIKELRENTKVFVDLFEASNKSIIY